MHMPPSAFLQPRSTADTALMRVSSHNDMMVVFGGLSHTGARLNDLWVHHISGPHPDNHTWSLRVPAAPASATMPEVMPPHHQHPHRSPNTLVRE